MIDCLPAGLTGTDINGTEILIAALSVGEVRRNGVPYGEEYLEMSQRRPLYLKTQSVPRCQHFSSGL